MRDPGTPDCVQDTSNSAVEHRKQFRAHLLLNLDIANLVFNHCAIMSFLFFFFFLLYEYLSTFCRFVHQGTVRYERKQQQPEENLTGCHAGAAAT